MRASAFSFTRRFTVYVGICEMKLLAILTMELSFHLQKYTIPSLQKSNVPLSLFFISLIDFILPLAPRVLFSLTVPIALIFLSAKSARRWYFVKKLSKKVNASKDLNFVIWRLLFHWPHGYLKDLLNSLLFQCKLSYDTGNHLPHKDTTVCNQIEWLTTYEHFAAMPSIVWHHWFIDTKKLMKNSVFDKWWIQLVV